MSTDLVQVGAGAAPAMPPPEYVDESGLGLIVRLKPGRFSLVQPMTVDPKDACVGQYLDNSTGVGYDELRVVILRLTVGRTMFPPGADLTVEPLCKSDNGVFPSDFSKVKQSATCASCPHSRWGADRKRPDCNEEINAVVVYTDTDMPYYIKFKGTSIGPVKHGLEAVNKDILIAKRKTGENVQLFDYAITFSSETGKTKKNKVAIITKAERLSSDDSAKYRQMLVEMNAAAAARQQENLVEAEVDAAVDNVVQGEIVEEV